MFVDISEKNILIIGGGKIATRRIKTLLRFADQLTVIAKEKTKELEEILDKNDQIVFFEREFLKEDYALLEQMDMVLAATDNRELNRSIVMYCKNRRIMVNTSDDQKLCDFYFPAVIEKDEIVIGINSGGKNPSNVRKMRERIENNLRE